MKEKIKKFMDGINKKTLIRVVVIGGASIIGIILGKNLLEEARRYEEEPDYYFEDDSAGS